MTVTITAIVAAASTAVSAIGITAAAGVTAAVAAGLLKEVLGWVQLMAPVLQLARQHRRHDQRPNDRTRLCTR